MRSLLGATLPAAAAVLTSVCPAWSQTEAPAQWRTALAIPSAASLQAHASFLSSDALEGRDTPSAGLDVAAEYIAAQFRRWRLAPPVNGGYFQTSHWYVAEPHPDGVHLSFSNGTETLPPGPSAVAAQAPVAVAISDAPLAPVSFNDPEALDGAATLEGKVVFSMMRSPRDAAAVAWLGPRLRKLGAAAWVIADPARTGLLRRRGPFQADSRPELPVFIIEGEPARSLAARGAAFWRVSIRAPAWAEREVTLRNVIGVVPG
jgi:hypothetical protein